MSDDACASCMGAVCGICCIGITTAMGTWCNTRAYGADGCCDNGGCCGSCCSKSFNEDTFDEDIQKDMEKTRDPNAASPSTNTQPTANQGMTMAVPAG
ncbi:hypothetical protein BDQ17DRAFT_1218170, partial [Cyathus striatus]